jgi:hypothetical protein
MSGSDDRLADAREYLRGSRILWSRLAGTAIGSLILAWATGFADFVTAYFSGAARIVGGIFAWVRAAIVGVLRLGLPGLDAGFQAAREEILGLDAGFLTFALGVAFVVAWFWVLSVAADRLEVR